MNNNSNVNVINKTLYRAKRKDNDEWVYWNIYGEICKVNGKKNCLTITKGAHETYYHFIYQAKHLIVPESVERLFRLS